MGYGPPPEGFRERVDEVLEGVDTFKALSARYAKTPGDVEVLFKLGMKYDRRYDRDKAAEFYGKVLAADPDGTKGTTEFLKERVSYTQYAELNLGQSALGNRPPDPAPLLAFIKKHRRGAAVRQAYDRLSSGYFVRSASKEEAAPFFEEYAAAYPDDPRVIDAWLTRIIRDNGPFDLGEKLGAKAIALMGDSPNPRILLDIAQVRLLKGDTGKAVETADSAIKTIEDGGESARMSAQVVVPSAAGIFMKAERQDKALEAYGPEFAKANWDNAGVLSRYASFWAGQGGSNAEGALAAAKRIVELSPDSYSSWSTLSSVHRLQKNLGEAIKAAEKAVELAPAGRAKEAMEKALEGLRKEAEKKQS